MHTVHPAILFIYLFQFIYLILFYFIYLIFIIIFLIYFLYIYIYIYLVKVANLAVECSMPYKQNVVQSKKDQMDMGCCYSEFHALCDHQTTDDRITRETLSNNNPCPSSPSSTIYIYIYFFIFFYFIYLFIFLFNNAHINFFYSQLYWHMKNPLQLTDKDQFQTNHALALAVPLMCDHIYQIIPIIIFHVWVF